MDDAEVFLLHRRAVGILQHALGQHLLQRRVVVVGPLVGGDIDGALRQRQQRIFVAAGEHDLAEIGVGIGDAHLVQLEARHVVAGGRIRIDQTEVLALQIIDGLVRRCSP